MADADMVTALGPFLHVLDNVQIAKVSARASIVSDGDTARRIAGY